MLDGDIFGALSMWGEVFSNFFKQFSEVFAPRLPEISLDKMTLDLGSFDTLSIICAGLWFFFVLFTHTPFWERFSKKRLSNRTVILLSVLVGFFMICTCIPIIFSFPIIVHLNVLLLIVLVLAALGVFIGVCYLVEYLTSFLKGEKKEGKEDKDE